MYTNYYYFYLFIKVSTDNSILCATELGKYFTFKYAIKYLNATKFGNTYDKINMPRIILNYSCIFFLYFRNF